MTALAISHPEPALAFASQEELIASQWSRLVETAGIFKPGIKDGARLVRLAVKQGGYETQTKVVSGGLANVITFSMLPATWQQAIEQMRLQMRCHRYADLLSGQAPTLVPPKAYAELSGFNKAKCLVRRAAVEAFEAARGANQSAGMALAAAQLAWTRERLSIDCVETREKIAQHIAKSSFYRLLDQVAGAGGHGNPNTPLSAYGELRNVKKPALSRPLPDDLTVWIKGQLTDSAHGIRSVDDVHREAQARWERGVEVPGLGIRQRDEIFPLTVNQFRKHACPGAASRQLAGKGKFAAKVKSYTAAMPKDWSDVEPMRVVMYDDKELDLSVMTDDGRSVFRPSVYIAYDAGTRRILNFVARQGGKPRKLDVEGLFASTLAQHGMGGAGAGWPSRHVFERGTIALDQKWDKVLYGLWPGCLEIDRTGMIGGATAPGDYQQKRSGNFFAKGVIESMMWALDNFAKRLPGATGNNYGEQPATLGDTTLTLEKLANSARGGHKPARSLIEESLLTSAMANALDWLETGELLSARDAAKRQGIQPPLLYWTDFVALLGELFREFNNRRGHKMQGFAKVRVEGPRGTLLVTESPNDKAERLAATMTAQGRSLVNPNPRDVAVLLHSLKRVLITANGAKTTVNPFGELIFWSPDSQAQRDAAAVVGGQQTRLALVNPIDPSALYLLKNPPSHIPASALEIPANFSPQLDEVLPLYKAPSAVDPVQLGKRRRDVQRFNLSSAREALIAVEPILASRHAQREELASRLDPLRIAIRSAESVIVPMPLQPSQLSADIDDAERGEATRADVRRATQAEARQQSAEQINAALYDDK